MGANVSAAACGGAGVATLASGIAAPAALPLGAVALGAGAVAAGCGLASKLIAKKVTKHERVEMAAKTRFDTVSAVVSKALQDQVSHDEYAVVLREAEQYRQRKQGFHVAYRKDASGETAEILKAKNELRAQVQAELLAKLADAGKSSSQ